MLISTRGDVFRRVSIAGLLVGGITAAVVASGSAVLATGEGQPLVQRSHGSGYGSPGPSVSSTTSPTAGPSVSSTTSPTAGPSVSHTSSPTTSPTKSPIVTSTPTPAPEMPKTGSGAAVTAGAGAALLLGGAGALYLARRRRYRLVP